MPTFKLTDLITCVTTSFEDAWEMGRTANYIYHKLHHPVVVEFWHDGKRTVAAWGPEPKRKGEINGN